MNLLSILVGLVKKVSVKKKLLQSGFARDESKLRVRDGVLDNKITHLVIDQTFKYLGCTAE